MSHLHLSDRGILDVFPEIPVGPTAFTQATDDGCWLVSAEHSGALVLYIDITARADGEVRIKNPWRGRGVRVVDQRRLPVDKALKAGVVTFRATQGELYHLTAE